MLRVFAIEPDHDLAIMQPAQDLFDITARVLARLRGVLDAEQPAAVLVQGDTTTAMAAALAAFYCRRPVGHVEAGLRTDRLYRPVPRRDEPPADRPARDLALRADRARRRPPAPRGRGRRTHPRHRQHRRRRSARPSPPERAAPAGADRPTRPSPAAAWCSSPATGARTSATACALCAALRDLADRHADVAHRLSRAPQPRRRSSRCAPRSARTRASGSPRRSTISASSP